ncbi:Type II secretion system (T2SS), protein F [Halorubrum aquaticum]|uniref:Type II secretion system (T2SS), protein F n=1 Tax=Halorubrum aquaticum TaxID=387340 RepID=A0A1I3AS69_9EURY|nr:Type II secretion system (T2SS), protein F [Halorubrum aquaticum]
MGTVTEPRSSGRLEDVVSEGGNEPGRPEDPFDTADEHTNDERSPVGTALATIAGIAGGDDGGVGSTETGSDELGRAIAFLEWESTAERVIETGYRAGLVAGLCFAVAGVVLAGVGSGLLAGLSGGLAATHAVHRGPVWLAALRRTRALGATPGLVGRLVLRMRLDPSTERAVRFAARTGRGPLAENLLRHERRCVNGPTSGLRGFAREWGPWFPAIERASTLVRTAAAAPAERRGRCLDRALETTLSGTTERLAEFVGDVQGPVSALYAFGVLLPLALVALLPAAAASGVPIPPSVVAGIYLVALPAGLLAAAAWLLSKRPVAFPPPTIGSDHPDVPDRRIHAVAVGVGSGVVAGIASGSLVASWAAPIGAIGVGTGAALVVVVRPRRAVLSRVTAIESGLPDAMTIVGGDVAEGVSVERAVANAGDKLDGATGDVFELAARRSDTLRVDVREAFLGDGGPAATVPSPRVQGTVALLAVAAREGRPAGDVLLELADQLERLRELERDARRQLATVTGTLSNTAAVFAPLVGGATVALATGVETIGTGGLETTAAMASDPLAVDGAAGSVPSAGAASGDAATALSVPVLGRIVGVYVVLLAGILTALGTGLERGFDGTLVAYRIGIALPTATTTYLLAFAAAGMLL